MTRQGLTAANPVGEAILERMEALEVGITGAAKLAGVPPSTLRRLIASHYDPGEVQLATALKLCEAFGSELLLVLCPGLADHGRRAKRKSASP